MILALSAGPPPALNTWTQLTGTYDAATGLMTLYVNGQQAGTATDTTPFASVTPPVIGYSTYGGIKASYWPGEISNVQAFGYALSPGAVQALYDGQSPTTGVG
jgi:large repetitive protein